MRELDLSMVRLAQEKSAQYRQEQAKVELDTVQQNGGVKQKITQYIETMRQRFYQASIQTSDGRKRQEIFGKPYVGKENLINSIKTAVKVATGILILSATFKSADAYMVLEAYYDALDQKMQTALTNENINAYEYDHKNPVLNAIEDYNSIQEAIKELDASEFYNFLGKNVVDSTKQYTVDEGNGYHLSNIKEDAIDMVTDDIVNEYKSQSRWSK